MYSNSESIMIMIREENCVVQATLAKNKKKNFSINSAFFVHLRKHRYHHTNHQTTTTVYCKLSMAHLFRDQICIEGIDSTRSWCGESARRRQFFPLYFVRSSEIETKNIYSLTIFLPRERTCLHIFACNMCRANTTKGETVCSVFFASFVE